MRVIILHQSPETDPAADEFAQAAEEFNRGLDIRLRFLDVGFTIRRLAVAPDDDFAAVEFSEMAGSFRPGVVVALGTGVRLLECVSAAVKTGLPIVLLIPPAADRTSSAMARISDIVVNASDEDLPPPLREGLEPVALNGRPAGPTLVDLIVRSVKERQRS